MKFLREIKCDGSDLFARGEKILFLFEKLFSINSVLIFIIG